MHGGINSIAYTGNVESRTNITWAIKNFVFQSVRFVLNMRVLIYGRVDQYV